MKSWRSNLLLERGGKREKISPFSRIEEDILRVKGKDRFFVAPVLGAILAHLIRHGRGDDPRLLAEFIEGFEEPGRNFESSPAA